jgi:hypothetical protein
MYDDGQFEWDEEKADANRREHRVTFTEAREVFHDPREVVFFDHDHSDDEPRYQRVGLSGRRLLFVVYTMRGEKIRIIHARKATKRMVRDYEEEMSEERI